MQVKNKPPKYAKLGRTAMRFQKGSDVYDDKQVDRYWRDAGHWGVAFRFDEIEQKWYSVCNDSDTQWLNNVELVPITRNEWKEDNKGYL